jgi:hypothetical protein
LLGQCIWALANFSIDKKYYAGVLIDSKIPVTVSNFILDRNLSKFVRQESVTLICNLLSINMQIPLSIIQKPLLTLGRYLSILDVTEKNFNQELESVLTSIVSAFLTQNQYYSDFVREVFVIALGSRERLLQVI